MLVVGGRVDPSIQYVVLLLQVLLYSSACTVGFSSCARDTLRKCTNPRVEVQYSMYPTRSTGATAL